MFGYPSDAEEVQAILSEEKLQPMFWCRIGFHKWTRWTVVKAGRVTSRGAYTNVPYEEIRRECKCCGFPQQKVEWIDIK